jgi:hypothetical protein
MQPREWRPITWVIVVFTVAMAIWFVAALKATGGLDAVTCEDTGEARGVCELEREAQALDPGPTSILALWMGGAAVLAVVWWATNRDIPHRRIWLVVKTVIGLGVSGIMLVAGIVGYLDDSQESRALSALPGFDEHLTDYTPAATRPSAADPYLQDGVITLLVPRSTGVEDASINGRLYQILPSGLRAGSPGEVSMVVRTECWWAGHSYMHNIGISSNYYECKCEVELVDMSASPPTAVEVDRQFGTDDLPEEITAGDHYRWGCPWHDIATYLRGLPRQQKTDNPGRGGGA